MHLCTGPGGGLKARGHVAHVLRPVNRTSGRRLGALGNVYGTYVCARISWEWCVLGCWVKRWHLIPLMQLPAEQMQWEMLEEV